MECHLFFETNISLKWVLLIAFFFFSLYLSQQMCLAFISFMKLNPSKISNEKKTFTNNKQPIWTRILILVVIVTSFQPLHLLNFSCLLYSVTILESFIQSLYWKGVHCSPSTVHARGDKLINPHGILFLLSHWVGWFCLTQGLNSWPPHNKRCIE